MKRSKLILIVVIAILVVIQFFRPEKNTTNADPVNDIATKYMEMADMDILMILNDACYNCHSNYTTYPWYYNIQPVGWWMAYHINDAKKHVNFSEFATYSKKDAAHAFHEIYEVMSEHTMPIKSYRLMHDKANLTDEQFKKVAEWAKEMEEKLD